MSDDDEGRIKHMELIQAVISRMAGNSFALKGWSITLVSALFALAADEMNEWYAVLALLPALSFWGLDAYYLRQEKLFRNLYDAVRPGNSKPPEGHDRVESYSMNTEPVKEGVDSWWKVVRSGTIAWLHVPIVLAVVAVTAFAWCNQPPKDQAGKTNPPSAETKTK